VTGQLRVAIVGCGRMGTQRARAARALGAEVVLVDRNRNQAEQLAAEFSPAARVFSADDDLDLDGVDAVFVCTPAAQRGPVELAAAAANVPVFVEKPVALSGEHARGMLDAFEATNVLNAAGYMNRYRSGVNAVREALIGQEVFAVQCHWVGNRYLKEWWTDPGISGSPFNDQATHLIDLCRYVAGEISEVVAVEHRSQERSEVADVVAVSLVFENGACGCLLHSYRAAEKYVIANFFTSAGRLCLEGWDFQLEHEPAPENAADVAGVTPIFLTETRAFLEAVRTGDRSLIRASFDDGYRSLLVVDAVHRSLAEGRRVAVAEPVPTPP
jgi:myo-inositol 2-dehydrogenase / D-chiro-inositol 1-dehydrogenase